MYFTCTKPTKEELLNELSIVLDLFGDTTVNNIFRNVSYEENITEDADIEISYSFLAHNELLTKDSITDFILHFGDVRPIHENEIFIELVYTGYLIFDISANKIVLGTPILEFVKEMKWLIQSHNYEIENLNEFFDDIMKEISQVDQDDMSYAKNEIDKVFTSIYKEKEEDE